MVWINNEGGRTRNILYHTLFVKGCLLECSGKSFVQ